MFLGQTLAEGVCDQFIEIGWFFSLLAIAPQHTDSINHAIKIFSDFKFHDSSYFVGVPLNHLQPATK